MNRNEYRRALIMLRSLKPGVSGYVRLERRTLMGTLQFTVNGITDCGELYAVMLYSKSGGYGAVRLDKMAAPRYGQTGLVWKFDPRSIEGRTLEQYDLAAVIEVRSGICELLLCGNLNGSVEADWMMVREAACRLFSPVRISGAPISPIDEKQENAESVEDQTIPPVDEAESDIAGENEKSETIAGLPEQKAPIAESEELFEAENEGGRLIGQANCDQKTESVYFPAQERMESALDDHGPDAPTTEEMDELDIPACGEEAFLHAARESERLNNTTEKMLNADIELDIPAQDDFPAAVTAGEKLSLKDPDAAWHDSVEPLRALFFSARAEVPFEGMEDFVFVRAPLSAQGGLDFCFAGISCMNGVPSQVCYAIPAAYSPETPPGLDGYVWRGDNREGCWVITEKIPSDSMSN